MYFVFMNLVMLWCWLFLCFSLFCLMLLNGVVGFDMRLWFSVIMFDLICVVICMLCLMLWV